MGSQQQYLLLWIKKIFWGTFAAEILEEEKKNYRYNRGERVGLKFVLNLTAIYLEF